MFARAQELAFRRFASSSRLAGDRLPVSCLLGVFAAADAGALGANLGTSLMVAAYLVLHVAETAARQRTNSVPTDAANLS